MSNRQLIGIGVVFLLLWWSGCLPSCAPTRPAQPVCPGPDCPSPPNPIVPLPKPRRPWGLSEQGPVGPIGKVALGGPVGPDGRTEVDCDLPVSQRIKNIGSYRDGAGMCVMSSIEMAARWANLEQMRGLRDWCANQPGGAYPSKVDRQLKEFCAAKSIPIPAYYQYEGPEPLPVIQAAIKSGRMPCITYSGQDGVRYRGSIAHMVCSNGLTEATATILDNNGIGENELLWMTPEDMVKRCSGRGSGWVFVWLAPGPPPVPRN